LLPDIQVQPDSRGVSIDSVGIDRVRHPVTFTDGVTEHAGVADISVFVSLPADRRGTHMSRMVEFIDEQLSQFDPRALPIALKAAAARLEVQSVGLSIAMPFAVSVTAPVSGLQSWQINDLAVRANVHEGSGVTVSTSVRGEVTSLCPCSKAVSDYGAHNQRSSVELTILGNADDPYPLRINGIAELIRSTGSSPIYPLVKRVDERDLTMMAYRQPAFVEDMIRDLSMSCRRIRLAHNITVRNIESIHSHDAVASLRWSPEVA
jgi:GTP cyclohydrolase IB